MSGEFFTPIYMALEVLMTPLLFMVFLAIVKKFIIR